MSTFIDEYLTFTSEYETPTSFWKWSSLVAIGASVRDNVYWIQKSRKLCCNIWVLLLADSAVHRKSGPIIEIDAILGVIKNTKVIRGRSSIQAVLDILQEKTTLGPKDGSGLFLADELASFFVKSDENVQIMTDIYDYRPEWSSNLRHGGRFKIKNLCVSMLAASNETLLRKVYDETAIYGGLLGRTFMIKPDEFRKGNSLFEATFTKTDTVVKKLDEISKVKGEVKWDTEAQKVFNNWYYPLRDKYAFKPDKSGVIGRIHTNVQKVAAILGLNNHVAPVVTTKEVEEAITMCMAILPNYEAYSMSAGKSTIAQAGTLFLNELSSTGEPISRKDILRKFWMEFDSETLDKIVTTLKEAGYLKDGYGGSEIYYSLTDKAKEIFKHGQKS